MLKIWRLLVLFWLIWLIFISPQLFVEATKLKVLLTDQSIFRGFIIGEELDNESDDWPAVGQLFLNEIYILISSE